MYHPAARRADGRAFVQLRYWDEGGNAYALGWSGTEESIETIVQAAQALAAPKGKVRLCVCAEGGQEPVLARMPGAAVDYRGEIWCRRVDL